MFRLIPTFRRTSSTLALRQFQRRHNLLLEN